MAQLVADAGVRKAGAPLLTLLVLSLLAGAFISMGAVFFTAVVTGSVSGLGATRLLGGIGFSLGLILVVIGGAELFTGNNLIAMAWASRMIRGTELIRNWVWVYIGNVAGCLGTALLVWWSGIHGLGGGAVGETALSIAWAKAGLGLGEAFARGILCNALVCLAVWLAMAGRSLADRILAILFPITAFVAVGFEHSIANWYFLPYALLLDGGGGTVSLAGVARNLAAVTAGNIVGGTLLVAGVYWLAYLRPAGAHPRPE